MTVAENKKKYGNRSSKLEGKKFNKLTVIERAGSKNKKALWLCQCDCGNKTKVISSNLTSGRIKTCGCSRNTDMAGRELGMLTVMKRTKIINSMSYWISKCECGKEIELPWSHLRYRISCGCLAGEFHGMHGKPIYGVWNSMKQRCINPNSESYKYYGEKGVTVCDDWKNSFSSFWEWSKSNGYREGLTIDRIDPYGNYEPSNCRWTTWEVQSKNKRIHKRKEDSVDN